MISCLKHTAFITIKATIENTDYFTEPESADEMILLPKTPAAIAKKREQDEDGDFKEKEKQQKRQLEFMQHWNLIWSTKRSQTMHILNT